MPSVDAALPDTPAWRQYKELKAKHPGALLFFRLGDFYELFGEDAREAASLLGLVLTQRQGAPMCGVPYHSHQSYLARLIKAGRKVAVAEQMEEAGKGKKIVAREVVRVVTPGTVVEDELLDPSSENFLVAVEHDIVGWGAACLDVSTGESWACQALNDRDSRRLYDLLARVRPAEILAAPRAAEALRLAQALPRACLTPSPAPSGPAPAWAASPAWRNRPLALKAALAARRYVDEAKFRLRELPEPAYREPGAVLHLDETAIRTLELVESPSGERRHTLWGQLDFCRTPMGSRKLKSWLLQPSADLREIESRQNGVEDLVVSPASRTALSEHLQSVADLPRVISRLSTRQAAPRDLGALARTLARLPGLCAWAAAPGLSAGLSSAAAALPEAESSLAPLAERLARALSEELPARLSDGGLIRDGFEPELDALRRLKRDSDQVLAELEERERRETGIPSLKAGYNSVFGYYLEITRSHAAKAPARYTRKQTLTGAERYITPELKELEARILSADSSVLRLEAKLFESLREEAAARGAELLRLADLLAELDALQSLAEAAARHGFVKPKVDLSYDLEIAEGRHPVLAALLPAGAFVPNSLTLNARDPQILVLTGPNMAGKSTYLRQNALIALLAQAGSFVPARSARIGLVDRILTRIGAQDALARGDSTFMVEMKETSHILRSATARSLVVLDEVGRGTSTFDGISIAWAVLEHLHSAYASREEGGPRGPRTLFATHYFELTELSRILPGIANANVAVQEWRGADGKTEIVFLHKIGEGPADRSYGLHVAALAGLPAGLVARAGEILQSLEGGGGPRTRREKRGRTDPELPLFEEEPALAALKLLDPESLSPLEALQALISLKKSL